jgi:drug/metabolite transporter (DMT)-like permease
MRISSGTLRADSLLLTTAIIWGFAFAFQRSGMEYLGPFAFTAARYALGALSLVPLLAATRRARAARAMSSYGSWSARRRIGGAVLAGIALFSGAGLQQVGLVTTTAANAGFITCLYVVIVPVIGAFFGKKSGPRIWLAAALALAGLYILSVGAGFAMSKGDLVVLAGAFFWAFHILLVGKLVAHIEALELAVGQFLTCALLSLLAALLLEPRPFSGILPAAIPLLYGGILSIGVAFTLQIVAQRTAHPAHASIILSMEALFAGIGGVLILGESVTLRLVAGGLLMLAGMVVSQIEARPKVAART